MLTDSVTLALLAAAAAVLPGGREDGRRLLLILGRSARVRSRLRLPAGLLRQGEPTAGVRAAALAGCAVLAGALAGPAAGVAAALAAAVALSTIVGVLARRRTRRAEDAVLEAAGALAGELRAGLAPPAALRAAAAAVSEPVASTLREAASTAALGGDPAAVLPPAGGLRWVAAAWRVSASSGASLGDVLDRVEADLRSDVAHLRMVDAELAGPRATAMLLAVLPALGLGLGSTMGAHPGHVLLHTVPGQLALVAGVGLDALGVWWTGRIIGSALGAA